MLVLKLNHLTDFRMNLNRISHESIPQWIYTSFIFYSKENANAQYLNSDPQSIF